MRALAIALAFIAAPAAADVVLVAGTDQVQIRLHSEAGPCVDGAKIAEYAEKGKPVILGCYKIIGPAVRLAFFDGDALVLPATVFLKPTTI